jgi:hypothetical protein
MLGSVKLVNRSFNRFYVAFVNFKSNLKRFLSIGITFLRYRTTILQILFTFTKITFDFYYLQKVRVDKCYIVNL